MAKIIDFPIERVVKKPGEARLKIEATPIPAPEDEVKARMSRIMTSLQKINKLMGELREKRDETNK